MTVTSTLVPLAQSCPPQTVGSLVRCSRQSITSPSLVFSVAERASRWQEVSQAPSTAPTSSGEQRRPLQPSAPPDRGGARPRERLRRSRKHHSTPDRRLFPSPPAARVPADRTPSGCAPRPCARPRSAAGRWHRLGRGLPAAFPACSRGTRSASGRAWPAPRPDQRARPSGPLGSSTPRKGLDSFGGKPYDEVLAGEVHVVSQVSRRATLPRASCARIISAPMVITATTASLTTVSRSEARRAREPSECEHVLRLKPKGEHQGMVQGRTHEHESLGDEARQGEVMQNDP
jgi:hypothetical protein